MGRRESELTRKGRRVCPGGSNFLRRSEYSRPILGRNLADPAEMVGLFGLAIPKIRLFYSTERLGSGGSLLCDVLICRTNRVQMSR